MRYTTMQVEAQMVLHIVAYCDAHVGVEIMHFVGMFGGAGER